MEVGAQDVHGLPLLAKPTPRPTTAIWLVNPRIPALSPQHQWNKAPVTLI